MPRWTLPLLLLGGCADPDPVVIGPQPQPVPSAVVALQAGRLVLDAGAGECVVQGGAASVTPVPPEGRVRVFDITRPPAVGVASIAADGSFTLSVRGEHGDLLRLEAETTQGFSAPLDLRCGRGPVAIVSSRRCLSLEPVTPLRFAVGDPPATIALRSSCGALLPRLRFHSGRGFRLVEAPLEPFSEYRLVVAPSGSTPADDVLVIDLGDDAPALVSLRTR